MQFSCVPTSTRVPTLCLSNGRAVTPVGLHFAYAAHEHGSARRSPPLRAMSLLEAAADGGGGGGGGWRRRYHAEGKVLLAIAIPIVFSNLLTVTMGIVDLAFVGRIGKTAGPDRLLIVYRCTRTRTHSLNPPRPSQPISGFLSRNPFHSLLLLNTLLQPLSQSTPVRS